MRNNTVKWLVMGLGVVVLMAIAYNMVYPEPRNIAEQRADFTLSAKSLALEMSQMESAKKYGGKVVYTFGRISAINGGFITLEDDVVISLLDSSGLNLKKGDSIAIKGRCIGYDDLLEEVKLDQASIIQE